MVVACAVALISAGHASAATWSAPVTVPGSNAASGAAIGRNAAGADTIGWLGSGAGSASDAVAASIRPLGGALATSILSAGAAPVDSPVLTVDPAGPVTLAWVAQGGAPGDPTQIDYVVGDSALSSRQTFRLG